MKILTDGDKIITLEELFRGKEKARKVMARLPFEKKIKALISLQEIAHKWAGKKDVMVWRI